MNLSEFLASENMTRRQYLAISRAIHARYYALKSWNPYTEPGRKHYGPKKNKHK